MGHIAGTMVFNFYPMGENSRNLGEILITPDAVKQFFQLVFP
jgi:hypothetical protein